MAEAPVTPDGVFEAVDLTMHHQPNRKTYGLWNILVRKQAYRWRASIANALLGKPTDLPCWRWNDEVWPEHWEEIRKRPLTTGARRLMIEPLRNLRRQWRVDRRFYLDDALNGPVHHAMLCLKFWQLWRQSQRTAPNGSAA